MPLVVLQKLKHPAARHNLLQSLVCSPFSIIFNKKGQKYSRGLKYCSSLGWLRTLFTKLWRFLLCGVRKRRNVPVTVQLMQVTEAWEGLWGSSLAAERIKGNRISLKSTVFPQNSLQNNSVTTEINNSAKLTPICHNLGWRSFVLFFRWY